MLHLSHVEKWQACYKILTPIGGHNCRIFKQLALQTMACDELKDDINNAASFCNRNSMTFCMWGLYDRNQHCIEH